MAAHEDVLRADAEAEKLPSAALRRRLQREHDAAIVDESQPVLRHRRPEQIAAQLFRSCAIRGGRVDGGVQIEGSERSASLVKQVFP